MPSWKQLLWMAGGLLLLASGLLLVYTIRGPASMESPAESPGPLAWLPADSGLVAGVELAELRGRDWLWQMVNRATGEVKADPEYTAFVEITDFDYTRDLDRLWLGFSGTGPDTWMAGVAEGRFDHQKIQDYARRQGARVHRHIDTEIYEVRTPPRNPGEDEQVFAFTFLDDRHVAFGSSVERAAMVLDCWLGRAPAIGTDEARRVELERLVAGRQLWVVGETAKWEPPEISPHLDVESMDELVGLWVLGLRVEEHGVELEGAARFHDPDQAEGIRKKLAGMLILGQVALAGSSDELTRSLRQALGKVELTRRDDTLELRVLIDPQTLSAVLRAAPDALQSRTPLPRESK